MGPAHDFQNLVPVLAETGRYPDAIRRGQEVLRMAEELGHPAPIAWAFCYLGYAYCSRGDADQAIDRSARSLALAREHDVRNLIQAASACQGAAYTLAGRAPEAVAWLEEAVETGQSLKRMDPFMLVSLDGTGSAGRPATSGSRGTGGRGRTGCTSEAELLITVRIGSRPMSRRRLWRADVFTGQPDLLPDADVGGTLTAPGACRHITLK